MDPNAMVPKAGMVEPNPAAKPSYPVFSPTVLWLLGVSHAGYVAGKMPTKA